MELAILAAAVPSLKSPQFQPSHPLNRHKIAFAEIAVNTANCQHDTDDYDDVSAKLHCESEECEEIYAGCDPFGTVFAAIEVTDLTYFAANVAAAEPHSAAANKSIKL